MSSQAISRLTNLEPRAAWPDEARDFTPWLADNLDHLNEAIGLELELAGREVAVEGFAADILARDVTNGSNVLIENQLERTDHQHLGQIMTYLAGLDARTVIWIAPEFREPHLSAIGWLNQHTSEAFAFFAVRLRVVSIAGSPPAPIFEVMEKPNGWERRLQHVATRSGGSARGDARAAFWAAYLERFPRATEWGLAPRRHSNAWVKNVLHGRIWLSFWIGDENCGVFVRGPFGTSIEETTELIEPYIEELSRQLSVPCVSELRYPLLQRLETSAADPSNWPQIIDWMEETRERYTRAINQIVDLT